jgi:hypothetical protein
LQEQRLTESKIQSAWDEFFSIFGWTEVDAVVLCAIPTSECRFPKRFACICLKHCPSTAQRKRSGKIKHPREILTGGFFFLARENFHSKKNAQGQGR